MPSTAFDHVTLGQRVLFGSGAAAANVRTAVEELGGARVLLVAGASARATADELAAAVPVVHRITDVVRHVPAARAARAVEDARSTGADLVLTVGGGSATGLGKAVALATGLPIVAVPTTFAGSEATDVWGSTSDGVKTTGSDSRVLPKAVVYDATLTLGLPVQLAVASGLNAVAHAVDGFWAPRADPINRALGTEGLRALVPGLRALAADPGGIEGRERTLYGAYLAAVAFASAGSGLHHKICHVLGGAFDLPHAELHAVVLPYVAAFNAPAAPAAVARITDVLGGGPAGAALLGLKAELGGPPSLAAIGLREQDLSRAVALILPAVPPTNPRPVDAASLGSILRSAWAGDDLDEE
ncbi:maleylacetate reductase [Amnibacterium kyonggiense]|uniref:Maleylacetate reductase n=1 Tax=Amnibacterium kyonggiense TaxID=595671 RepID=A0A4V3EA41_9MICO|nr:maleylacetate reductase [Amnibacterium kyonggiense]TDS74486.1 maleylacetate reductase [Amnibacterium kyonggiense]